MKLIYILCISFWLTHTKGQGVMSNSSFQQDSLLIDREGNRYSIKFMPDGNLWMTNNLLLKIPGSYFYNNTDEQCLKYGRLYTWESAKMGCRLIGEGWELPSANSWQALSSVYSQGNPDSIQKRKNAFSNLLLEGGSAFHALLGGGRDLSGQYARVEAHGFYWTATESGTGEAWFANFAKGSGSLYIQMDGEKERAFSVRCIKLKDKRR